MIRLLITMGDPTGIGPEVLLANLTRSYPASISVIGDLEWLRSLQRRFKFPVAWNRFRWVDVRNVPPHLTRGRVQPEAGKAAHAYLKEAIRLLREGQADALVTAPVSKEAIVKAGIRWVGHTEFLGRAFGRSCVMMFVTKRFRVSLVTTHVGIRELPGKIRTAQVIRVIRQTQETLKRDFGIPRPKIGLAALNPHGGEGGLFGWEEKRILKPAVRAVGGQVEGPLPSDSLMQAASRGVYDAVVALYHDQALIPVKLLGWEEAVNVTLGLPFVRTSPVHGTAFDLAGKGRANPASMQAAIKLAIQLAQRRKSARGV